MVLLIDAVKISYVRIYEDGALYEYGMAMSAAK